MEKYSSPHLRLHGKPEAKGKPARPSEKGAMHHEPEDEHAAGAVEHVTKTHPGETQPYEKTGIHAVHVNHTGGGMHNVHVHHEGGKVESHHGVSHEEAKQIHEESFPTSEGDDAQHDQNAENDTLAGGGSMANMSSLGGE